MEVKSRRVVVERNFIFCGVDEVAVSVGKVCMEVSQGCEVLQDGRSEVWRCL